LNNKYSTVMESINVTKEMRKRILDKIKVTDFDKIPIKISNNSYKKYITIAACFLLLFAGIIGANSIILSHESKPPLQAVPNTNVIPNIKNVDSIDELSQTVGFEIAEIENIPFTVESTTYTILWDTLAEITYTGDNNELVFRKAAGNDDISGDYNVYNTEKTCDMDGYTVILKGNDGTYNLAVWQKDGYSYSIMTTEGISENEMTAMIENVK